MSSVTDEVLGKVKDLSDLDKLKLVDALLEQLDRPDPELDRIWAQEATNRWTAYREGRLKTIDHDQVMSRYRKE